MSADGQEISPSIDSVEPDGSGSADTVPREALAKLYADFAPLLTNTLRKAYGNGPPDPEDAAQQAFERMLERPDLSAIRDLKAFLWGTAKNLMLSGNRSVNTALKYQSDVESKFFSHQSYGTDPQRVINAREHVVLINKLLEQMPSRRRRAFYLRRVEGLTVREIADRLGVSSAAVSKHIAAASAEIDIRLADEHE